MCGAVQAHDRFAHLIGVGDVAKNHLGIFAGTLDVQIAVVENGWKKSAHRVSDVLHACKRHLAHVAHKQSTLIDADDALACAATTPDVDLGYLRGSHGNSGDILPDDTDPAKTGIQAAADANGFGGGEEREGNDGRGRRGFVRAAQRRDSAVHQRFGARAVGRVLEDLH